MFYEPPSNHLRSVDVVGPGGCRELRVLEFAARTHSPRLDELDHIGFRDHAVKRITAHRPQSMSVPKKFRLKYTLADGRKIYATVGRRFILYDSDAIESDVVRKNLDRGAYTPDLGLLFDTSSGSRPDGVRIAKAKLEPASSPVDTAAFILGGKHATEPNK